jgi:uncharacterized membrane protein HdeD (DUF308 family)
MVAKPMLLRSWWMLALRGVLALLFGVLALLLPGPTVLSLVLLFAVYALLAGIVYLVGTVRNRRHATGAHALDWWLLLALGVVSVLAGILATMRPALAALVLVLIIGVNAFITGVLDIVLAVRLRNHARGGDWLLLASGVASIIFGTVLIVLPGVGALALVWLIGVYAIVAGILYLTMAVRSYERVPAAATAAAGQPDGAAPDARQAATVREGVVVTKAPVTERRVGERRMTPAGQH